MIRYIFEDDPNDVLSRLFRYSYAKNVAATFEYAKGCGNLKGFMQRYIEDPETAGIVIFLDVIPGNRETRQLYFELRSMARRCDKFAVIVPILGAEYYFIKAFWNTEVAVMKDIAKDCADLNPYFRSRIIKTSEDSRYSKTFEGCCKLVQRKAFNLCANAVGESGRYFYEHDCVESEGLSLYTKSLMLLAAYPCVPSGVNGGNMLDAIALDIILRNCIDTYNQLSRRLMMEDTNGGVRYKELTYVSTVLSSN